MALPPSRLCGRAFSIVLLVPCGERRNLTDGPIALPLEQDTEVWQCLPRQPAALALTLHLTEASGHGVPAGVLNATPGMSAGAPRVKPSRRLGPKFMGTDGTIGLTSALQESWIWAAWTPKPSSLTPRVYRCLFRSQTFDTAPSVK